MLKHLLVLAAALFCMMGNGAFAQTLTQEIDALLNDGNTWGVLIQSDDAMVTYYQKNKDSELTPASNTKMVTTAAAFGLLGPDHAFETRVYANGTLSGGTLTGDLNLVVEHDITWNTYCLNSSDQALDYLAQQLRAKGLQTVTGNVNVYGASFYAIGQFDDVRFSAPTYQNQTVADVFRTSLSQAGITVSGSAVGRTGFSAPGTLYHTHLSTELLYDNEETNHAGLDEMPLTLATACIDLNRVSHNAMADALLMHIGYKISGSSTLDAGAAAALDWLENSAGIDTQDITYGDGSGLARGADSRPGNQFSAEFFVQLVRYMTTNYAGWDTSLAISCKDGTVGSRLCSAGLSGRVHAKSGTLYTTVALSGYMDHPLSGERLFFSFLANNSSGINSTTARAAMDSALTTIANGFVPVIPTISHVANTPAGLEIHAVQQFTGLTSLTAEYSINGGPFSGSIPLALPAPYLIQTRSGQPNVADYSEVQGTWADTSANTEAPGATSSGGGRWAVPIDAGGPDIARFTPGGMAAGLYEADVTTYGGTLSDNAHRITVRINDANGLRARPMDLSFETTGDVWAPLGLFAFAPGQSHSIEFDNATQANHGSSLNSRMSMAGVRFVPVTAKALVPGVQPGDRVDVRLVASNGTQSSPSSDTFSARRGTAARILLVDGNDRWRGQSENTSGTSHDFVARVGAAIASEPFDSAEHWAVLRGHVPLAAYDLVIWLLGEESTQDESFSDAEQALLTTYLANGGRLIVSGAEVGWDLEAQGTATDLAFLRDVLRTDYVADDTTSSGSALTPRSGDIFAGIDGLDYGGGAMTINYPDVLAGTGGSRVVLDYAGTSEGAAVAWRQDPAGPGAIVFGFPVSMISSLSARTALMSAAIGYLLPASAPAGSGWVLY